MAISRTFTEMITNPHYNYYSIEGIDGSGKTTVLAEIEKILSDKDLLNELIDTTFTNYSQLPSSEDIKEKVYNALYTNCECLALPSPNGSEYKQIRKLLKEHKTFGIDRSFELLARFILDMDEFYFNYLQDDLRLLGKVLISDRSLVSTFAYQSKNFSLKEIAKMCHGLKFPKHVFYLNIPVDRAIGRIESRNGTAVDYFENKAELTRISKTFKQIFREFNNHKYNKSSVTIIDSYNASPIDIAKHILTVIIDDIH